MAQDINDLPPQSGRYLREDGTVYNLADDLSDRPIARMTVGTAAPANPQAGDFFYDTSGGPTLQIYDGAAWQNV